MLNKVNIPHELDKERARGQNLLDEVRELLHKEEQREAEILARLRHEGKELLREEVLSDADRKKVYDISEIRSICIRYRLRFLDAVHFKSEYPYEAISKIKAFEDEYGVKVEKFKIIAPEEVFDLKDVNSDPVLFASLGNGRYFFIHQWGNDLSGIRSLLYYPLRSIYTYTAFMWVPALLIAFGIPFSWLQVTEEHEMSMRFWLTIHTYIALFFFIMFLGSTAHKGFSENTWKSKYFNS
jgi:hypothetical protein